jgi:hypothetical protein
MIISSQQELEDVCKAISFANLAYEQTEDINTRLQIRASIIRFNMHKALQHNFMKDYKKVDEICLSVDQTIQNDVDLFIRNPAELHTILLFYVNYFEMLYERKVGRGRDLDEIIKKIDYLYQKSDKFQANPLLEWYYNYVNGNYFYFFKFAMPFIVQIPVNCMECFEIHLAIVLFPIKLNHFVCCLKLIRRFARPYALLDPELSVTPMWKIILLFCKKFHMIFPILRYILL